MTECFLAFIALLAWDVLEMIWLLERGCADRSLDLVPVGEVSKYTMTMRFDLPYHAMYSQVWVLHEFWFCPLSSLEAVCRLDVAIHFIASQQILTPSAHGPVLPSRTLKPTSFHSILSVGGGGN